MTKRDFFQMVLNTCGTTVSPWGEDEPAVVDFCHKAIEQMDATNAKRRENPKPSKESVAAAERRVQALDWLKSNEGEYDATTIGEGCGLTATQVPAALKQAVSGGLVEKSTIKVDSKHRKTVYKYIGE